VWNSGCVGELQWQTVALRTGAPREPRCTKRSWLSEPLTVLRVIIRVNLDPRGTSGFFQPPQVQQMSFPVHVQTLKRKCGSVVLMSLPRHGANQHHAQATRARPSQSVSLGDVFLARLAAQARARQQEITRRTEVRAPTRCAVRRIGQELPSRVSANLDDQASDPLSAR
jgi:hypothetical protein